ncbi:MAG: N-acetylmuramoyl-L-alanine amidase [Acidimicrobiales bacterium]
MEIVEQSNRLAFSRRTLMKGSAAAGIVITAPMVPSRAWATEHVPEVVDEPLEMSGAPVIADPQPDHAHVDAEDGSMAPAGATPSRHRIVRDIDGASARMLGVSWLGGPTHGASVRWRSATGWSEWASLHFDDTEHPDADEAGEAGTGRRVSAPLWVDRADRVEVVVPDGVTDPVLHLVGEGERTVLSVRSSSAGALAGIMGRGTWGAQPYRNGSPSTASALRLAVVHHTAGTNNYSADQVPAILRSTQAYHQNANGWSDIAYNFLVDRFGRLWEGRAGGIDKAIIGGHTYGCNTGTVGVCYIGNLALSGASLPSAAENAITALLSWKFNQVHAVSPVGSTSFAPVNSNGASKFAANVLASHPTVVGHSHFSSTQCPGQANLRVSSIRSSLTRMEPVLGVAPSPTGGYWLIDSRGQAHPRGGAPFHGSMAGMHLNQPMIGMSATANGKGYWMLARDGGIFSYGNAQFRGSTGGMRLNRPVVGMTTTKSGNGYWLVASDGGIFSFGDAVFRGSTGGMRLNGAVVGMARTPSGNGYWLFAEDGGIFSFGDAPFRGSGGGTSLPAKAVAVGVHPNGNGYWLVLADGSVLAFNVPNRGRVWATSADPVVGIAVTSNGGGYWLARRSGSVVGFGNAG